MSAKRILLLVVFVGFMGLTIWAALQTGFVGFYEALFGNAAGVTAFCDLAIALGLVSLWLLRDARRRGVSPAPYLALTLALGSIGPLLYLLRRPEEAPSRIAAAPARA